MQICDNYVARLMSSFLISLLLTVIFFFCVSLLYTATSFLFILFHLKEWLNEGVFIRTILRIEADCVRNVKFKCFDFIIACWMLRL